MVRREFLVIVLALLTVVFSIHPVTAETVKTKVITLVDRDVACPEDEITLYSGSPTIMVTGEILSVSLNVTKSCRCRTCVYLEAYPEGNIVKIRTCSGGNSHSDIGGYSAKDYSIKTLTITAEKSDPSCSVSHITAKIIVKYTGDWVEPPTGDGTAPIPLGSVVLIVSLVILLGLMRGH